MNIEQLANSYETSENVLYAIIQVHEIDLDTQEGCNSLKKVRAEGCFASAVLAACYHSDKGGKDSCLDWGKFYSFTLDDYSSFIEIYHKLSTLQQEKGFIAWLDTTQPDEGDFEQFKDYYLYSCYENGLFTDFNSMDD